MLDDSQREPRDASTQTLPPVEEIVVGRVKLYRKEARGTAAHCERQQELMMGEFHRPKLADTLDSMQRVEWPDRGDYGNERVIVMVGEQRL